MDLNAMRARVRKLTGVRMESLLTPTELDQIINEAYLHVCALGDWSFLYVDGTVASAAGVTTYDLPAAVVVPRSVAITAPAAQRALLRPRTMEQFDRYPEWEAEPTDGVPWGWAVRSHRKFDVFPAPVDTTLTFTVRGWLAVNELALNADTPVFDAEFHPVVTLDAAVRVLLEEGDDSGRADRYRREAVSYLLRMGARYLPADDWDEPARIYVSGPQLDTVEPPQGGQA